MISEQGGALYTGNFRRQSVLWNLLVLCLDGRGSSGWFHTSGQDSSTVHIKASEGKTNELKRWNCGFSLTQTQRRSKVVESFSVTGQDLCVKG